MGQSCRSLPRCPGIGTGARPLHRVTMPRTGVGTAGIASISIAIMVSRIAPGEVTAQTARLSAGCDPPRYASKAAAIVRA